MSDNRRGGERFQVWFPVHVDEADSRRSQLTVSRNVSAHGILLSSTTELVPGAKVFVTFRIRPEEPERRVEGHVVRVEPNREDPDGLWPTRVAVEFDELVPELEKQLADAEAEREGYE